MCFQILYIIIDVTKYIIDILFLNMYIISYFIIFWNFPQHFYKFWSIFGHWYFLSMFPLIFPNISIKSNYQYISKNRYFHPWTSIHQHILDWRIWETLFCHFISQIERGINGQITLYKIPMDPKKNRFYDRASH